MTTRLGIDVGGTFTDVVVIRDGGQVLVEKVPSTPGDPSRGIFNGIRKVEESRGVTPGEVTIFSQGSTVATNALLESKLPRTALVMTAGFADVLEIGNGVRQQAYNLRIDKPEPYVPRDLVFEIRQRMDRLGEIVTEMQDADVEALIDELEAADVEAVAICLLFSFRNNAHEVALAARLRERLPNLEVAISSAVSPELGEYARANTAAVSAALQPLIATYMDRIAAGIDELEMTAPSYVMQSNGGVMSVGEAADNAHRMVLSGPAGGVLAATRTAASSGNGDLITFDMGGTSTDIALIRHGEARLVRRTEFDGKPLLVPQFDIHTIGSGGGSIAHVDESGLLRVGPESAGAVPGPACYGRGGTRPTTTDAQLVLGRIHAERFLGGEMALDKDAAILAVRTHVADPLGISVEEAAMGILRVADTLMAKGVRVVSVNRGFDPRDFLLLPFGGAGPMHAAGVAVAVGAGGVLVPRHPGIFSALGMAQAELKYDYSAVIDDAVINMTGESLGAAFQTLVDSATERLRPAGAARVSIRKFCRARYAWQDNDVLIEVPVDEITNETLAGIVTEFHDKHYFEFGHNDPEGVVEIASIEIEALGSLGTAESLPSGDLERYEPVTSTSRPVYFDGLGWADTPVYERAELTPGALIQGPAVIEEREATTVVPPLADAELDAQSNIRISFVTR
jgi:N-methylhydantoinase A